MRWKTWNDQLSVIILVAFVGVWIAKALGWNVPEIVLGVTVAKIGDIVQFYFRRSDPAEAAPKPPVV